ncbi:hypothetical protein CDV53_09270 [Haematobacter missouriensis]|uniref:Uncharacterized protein n=1 Tax=Haematobacter missouriensis TaxID=366616 RepID=A0ABX3ZX89_9RHOB|nr:hypothetical protein CDV53_09270 [Haematobacter missouriensis]
MAAWQRGSVAAWQRGSVAAWQRGSVAAWQRGSVAAWQRSSPVWSKRRQPALEGSNLTSRETVLLRSHFRCDLPGAGLTGSWQSGSSESRSPCRC